MHPPPLTLGAVHDAATALVSADAAVTGIRAKLENSNGYAVVALDAAPDLHLLCVDFQGRVSLCLLRADHRTIVEEARTDGRGMPPQLSPTGLELARALVQVAYDLEAPYGPHSALMAFRTAAAALSAGPGPAAPGVR